MSEISVIIPTYNEAENLPPLMEKLFTVFRESQLDAEVLIVDDNSPDGTANLAREFAKQGPVVVIERKNERGLASAVIEGFRQSKSKILLVCDADLSHPIEKIPDLVMPIQRGEAEMTIGSRYVHGGKTVGWPWHRKFASKFASLLAWPLCSASDPMSGFFAFRRDLLERATLAPIGYKIGLEILVRCRVENFLEVPIVFRERERGASKLGTKEILNYLRHLHRLGDLRWPAAIEFLRFCFVGTLGFLVDLTFFAFCEKVLEFHYLAANSISFSAAVLHNFVWNKFWTFRGKRRGRTHYQYLGFLLIAVLALILRNALMVLLIEQIGIPIYAAFCLGVIVTMAINFFGSRWLVFRRQLSA